MEKPVKIHVLDVGHGESIVIELPDERSYGIIDCHTHRASNRRLGEKHDPAEPKALNYFRAKKDRGIEPVVEFACLTHPHIDHFRGYAALLAGIRELDIPIRELWDFGVCAEKAIAMKQMALNLELLEQASELEQLCYIQEELEDQGTVYRMIVSAPQVGFWSHHDVSLDVIWPDSSFVKRYAAFFGVHDARERRQFLMRYPFAAEDNIVSSAFLLSFGDFRVVLGGDITNGAWQRILGRTDGAQLRSHAVKVPHHGSKDGCFPSGRPVWPSLIRENERLVAIISGGYRYGLPARETIASLRDHSCSVYCTGRVVEATPRAYRPTDSNGLVDYVMEKIGVELVEEYEETGHGNVTIVGHRDGRFAVSTENSEARLSS